jgi:molybdopterin/thiamine biosynthesis adenylyltransferase
MSLTSAEIQRYKRHLILKEVGGAGQQKLKQSRVLLIGAGGLGSPMLMYLAAGGIGRIGIADHDTVSLDNLQRQIAHDTARVGMPKVESAAATARALNPHVEIVQIREKVTAENALELISGYDIVADGSDNFDTRYLVNDACYFAGKPLVFAALGPFDGYITTFRAFEAGADGTPNPSYRCLFPDAPPPGAVARCEEAGILGAVAGVVGTLQATEVLKVLLGVGAPLVGRLLIYEALSARFETMNYGWDSDNPLNGRSPSIRDLSIHAKGAETAIACAVT